MAESNKLTAYIGIIHNGDFESKTIVTAANHVEAKAKVLEKYKESLDVYFTEEDLTILPFSERNN